MQSATGASLDHFVPERLHIAKHSRVLRPDALHHIESRQEIVEALGAEDDLDCATAIAVDVQRPQALGDAPLRDGQAALRHFEVMCVGGELVVDLAELDVGVVVGLDRLFEL